MVKLKQKSKRITCKRRYRIEKKIKDHNKKVTKEAKKNENKPKKRFRNMRIPNKFPLKEEILEMAEKEKQARIEEKKKKQQDKKKRKAELKKQGENGGAKSLSDLLKQAQSKQSKFDNQVMLLDNPFATDSFEKNYGNKEKENSLRTFYKEFKKVCDASDVLIEVLDARDPLGTRCPEVEQMISNSGKNQKLILLLNKIDLVPKENVKAWLKYLRPMYPTVAFKASTQNQNDKLSQSSVPVEQANQNLLTSSKCLGADILVKLLNNFSRADAGGQDVKTTITVGIIGLPNVGKSSIINSLKRSHACMIGSMPGLTRHMKEIKLDKHIKLLDCPGIVMSREEDSASLALKNCIKVENLADPIAPIDLLLKRCSKDQLVMKYNISDQFENSIQFLSLVAKRHGKVKKGGVADTRQAAQLILNDWNVGKLTYYTRPPSEVNAAKLKPFDTKIVTQLAPKFDIDALLQDDENAMFEDISDDTKLLVEGVEVESAQPIRMATFDDGKQSDDDEEFEDYEEEDGEKVEFKSDVMLNNKRKRKASESDDEEDIYEAEDIPRTKKMQKIESKKKLKKARRNDKLFNNLGDMFNNVKIKEGADKSHKKNGNNSKSQLYDFKADFKN